MSHIRDSLIEFLEKNGYQVNDKCLDSFTTFTYKLDKKAEQYPINHHFYFYDDYLRVTTSNIYFSARPLRVNYVDPNFQKTLLEFLQETL